MSITLETADLPALTPRWEHPAGVLLADYDPLSRHVLGSALRTARGCEGRLQLLACVDSFAPMETWPALDRAEVVVLAPCPQVEVETTIRDLNARGIRPLLLATRWDPQSLDQAIAAGAAGCLVKNEHVERIAFAALAVAAGYTLLSPELMPALRPEPTRLIQSHELPLTSREYEVLDLLSKGMSTLEAAKTLGVSPTTIKSHVSHSLPKLNVRNRLEAVLRVKDGH